MYTNKLIDAVDKGKKKKKAQPSVGKTRENRIVYTKPIKQVLKEKDQGNPNNPKLVTTIGPGGGLKDKSGNIIRYEPNRMETDTSGYSAGRKRFYAQEIQPPLVTFKEPRTTIVRQTYNRKQVKDQIERAKQQQKNK